MTFGVRWSDMDSDIIRPPSIDRVMEHFRPHQMLVPLRGSSHCPISCPIMKLRHQGLLLLAIPLSCEIGFITAFLTSMAAFENAARQESRAKQIVTRCDEVKLAVGSAYLSLLSARLLNRRELVESIGSTKILIESKFRTIRELVGDDHQTIALVSTFQQQALQVHELLEDGSSSIGTWQNLPTLAQFTDKREYIEELADSLNRMIASAKAITDKYGAIAQEFQPREVQRRSELRKMAVVALTSSVVLVVLLAVFYLRSSMRRLDLLMSSIRDFSNEKREFVPLEGTDELSELDRAFRNAAIARYQAEDMRKDLINTVSHDLRSPLTAISGILSLAADGTYGEAPPTLSKKIERMSKEMERLIRLVNDLLDVEKIESGQFTLEVASCEISTIVDEAFLSVGHVAEKLSITLALECSQDQRLDCDRDRIIQVLVNLLSNALRFAPSGSRILVRASIAESGARRIEVIDEGPGVPQEQQAFIFERFTQLKGTTGKGTSGLGLAISKALISKHDGEIGVTSAPEGGACFWFTLPHKAE